MKRVLDRSRSLCWCISALLGLVLVALPGTPLAVAAPLAQGAGAFEEAECMFDVPLNVIEGEDVVCGYVTVPEQHSNPNGATIELAVAIILSRNPDPAPDPLFMAQGGPGGSSIDTFVTPIMDSPFRENRDVVLFDQRGTLYSEPALACPEIMDLTIATIEQDLTIEESNRRYEQAIGACHERLVDEGINLSAFNSLENAADIDALRVALGYDQINLYGVSYGTLLALHTMRDYPNGLRSVILDAVAPPQINFQVAAPQSQERAFQAFFAACADDPDCNEYYPNLEQVFYELIDQLNTTPARIPITDPETTTTYNAVMDGDGFEGSIFQMLYASDLIPALPRMIYDARAGNFAVMARFLSIIIFDRTVSEGMYFSVLCAEDADFTLQDVDLTGLPPRTVESNRLGLESLLNICRAWNVTPLGPAVDAPVSSNIPTLILSGAFDPITPAPFAEAVAQTLPRSYIYTFPNTGHGAIFTSDCADGLIQAFLDNPDVPPDASCVAAQTGPAFFTPDTVLPVPGLSRLLTLEGSSGPELLFFGLCLLFLLSALLIWPLAWVVRWMLGRVRPPQPAGAHIVHWLAVLNILLIPVFMGTLTFIAFRLALDNNLVVFYGLPMSWAALLLLPMFIALLTITMLLGTVQAWRAGYWSLWQRIYYSLLALAALGCTVVLAAWGMIGTPFLA